MAEQRTAQFSIAMTPDELVRLDDWAFAQRIRARSEAVRQLLEIGLAAHAAGWTPEGPPKPKKVRREG